MKKGNSYGGFLIVSMAILGAVSNSLVHGLPHISCWQLLFLKSFIGLILLCVIRGRQLPSIVKTQHFPLQAVKGFAGWGGNLLFIVALQKLPLADTSALSLTSAVMTTVGGALFFKEPISRPIFVAIILCCTGVVFILKPSNAVVSIYALFPILSAAAFSFSSLSIKKLSLKDSSDTTLFYLLFFMAVFSAVPAFSNWQHCSVFVMAKLAVVAALYVVSQMALIEAYTHAVAGFLGPFKFARFPLAILTGWLFFQENVGYTTLMGGLMIMASYYFVMKAKDMPSYGQQKNKNPLT
jgi:drug/metabolite transporter (DMT)-like permease